MKKVTSLTLASLVTMSGLTAGFSTGTAHADTQNNEKYDSKAGKVETQTSKNDTSKPIKFKKAQDMSVKDRVNSLTNHDKKLHDKEMKESVDENAKTLKVNQQYSYPDVNNYIAKNNIKHAKIREDARIDNLPKYTYKSGKYLGVAIHETANPNSNIYGEINYMYGHYYNAFVHGYVDGNNIIQTAPADYLAWGAGANANPFFYQIELVRAHSFDEFAKSVNNQAYLTAYMLKRNGLKPVLADVNRGNGTVISHNAISRYYGGSDHTDPYSYFSAWGYDMNQFFKLVQSHYNKLSGTASPQGQDRTQSKITGDTYTVKHGDTLYDIAQRSGSSIDNIKKWSGIKSNVLKTGQVLRVQPPKSNNTKYGAPITTSTYTVKHGDTLYEVSKRSGVSMDNIKKWSNLKSNVLYSGQVLKLKAPAPKTTSKYGAPIKTSTYKVVHGDTLYDISKRSGVSMDNIKKWSNLKSNVLSSGQILQLKAPAPKTTSSTQIKSKSYIVSKGDTLYKISKRSGVSVNNIKKYNNLKSNTIHVGQKLYLVPTHTVQKGETLYRIAKNNNISVSKLKTINGLTSNTIKVGQKLILK